MSRIQFEFLTDQTVVPSSIPSAEAFGSTGLLGVTAPASIPSAEAFGLDQLNLKIYPNSIPSAESFGADQVNLTIYPSSIASAEAFGNPHVNLTIYPNSIPSAEAFGTEALTLKIVPSSIPSAEAFGTLFIFEGPIPASIPSAEAFGLPIVAGPVTPSSIASAEAFGNPHVNLTIYPNSIPSAEAFGNPDFVILITPFGIPSQEAFGLLAVGPVIPEQIANGLNFELPLIITWTGIAKLNNSPVNSPLVINEVGSWRLQIDRGGSSEVIEFATINTLTLKVQLEQLEFPVLDNPFFIALKTDMNDSFVFDASTKAVPKTEQGFPLSFFTNQPGWFIIQQQDINTGNFDTVTTVLAKGRGRFLTAPLPLQRGRNTIRIRILVTSGPFNLG